MKLGTNTLLLIAGAGAVAGYLYMQNKKKKQGVAPPSEKKEKGGGFGGGGGVAPAITPAIVVAQPTTPAPSTPAPPQPTPQQQVAQNVTQQAPSSATTITPSKNFVDTDTEEMSMSYLDFDGNMD